MRGPVEGVLLQDHIDVQPQCHADFTREGNGQTAFGQARLFAPCAPSGKEAGLTERGLAVTFPGEVGVALGLDIDMVLQQDPFDWAAHT